MVLTSWSGWLVEGKMGDMKGCRFSDARFKSCFFSFMSKARELRQTYKPVILSYVIMPFDVCGTFIYRNHGKCFTFFKE